MRILIGLLCVVSMGNLPRNVNAQMVQVGPGYVRAPFVRVYRDPGGVYVRAPFVSTYTPWGPRGRIRQPQLAAPGWGALSWQELRLQIVQSCAALDRDLERLPSADFWRTSLKTQEIAALVSVDSELPPEDDARRRLTEILGTYESLGATPDFNRVARLPNFQALRGAMAEYVQLPEVRERRQLAQSSAALNEALGRFKTGEGWREYLLVAPNLSLADDQLLMRDDVPTAVLADALARFDSVAEDPEFATINELPEFDKMHAKLRSYFAQRQTPVSATAEELPPPAPSAP